MNRITHKPGKKLEAIAKSIRQNGLIGFIITTVLLFLFGWTVVLFDRSFIPTPVLIIAGLTGSIVSIFLFFFVWAKVSRAWFIISFGIFFGSTISLFLLIGVNHFTKEEYTIEVSENIIRGGNNYKWRRRYRCWRPFAVVEFDDVRRKIDFHCQEKKDFSVVKMVKLKMAKGCWGYYVIVDKQLY